MNREQVDTDEHGFEKHRKIGRPRCLLPLPARSSRGEGEFSSVIPRLILSVSIRVHPWLK
jgi:hypothetical protein